MKPETIAIHAGHQNDPATGAVIAPIHLSTTFERQPDGEYPHGFVYSRNANPNRMILEESISAIEGGVAAAAFASGSVAMMTVLQALRPGNHVIAPEDLYYGSRKVLTEIFVPWGLEVSFVDLTNVTAVANAIQPNSKLIIVESPSNPMIKVADIQTLADLAHQNNAKLLCDNTIPSPIGQRPFALGADMIVHATTKYLSGHSDVIGGILVTRAEDGLFERIRMIQTVGGAVPSPFDCWLAHRGLQTLPYRMRAQTNNAMLIAQFLDSHPAIETVLYPGLLSHPQHELAARQMILSGALMSVLVKGDEAAAMQVAANVNLFTRATSFGGTHSLIEHRASIEHPETTTPRNLLRLSIGLENVEDLIADLQQALLF